MPLRANPSRYRRLTQRNRAASSTETNGSGVRGARPNSLAVITVAGAEIVSALSRQKLDFKSFRINEPICSRVSGSHNRRAAAAAAPLCPPVPDSRGIVMIGLSGPLVRDANTRVGCGCCKPLGAASDVKGKESTVGARHAVLETLYSHAHRIGLDGGSCLLHSSSKGVSLNLFLVAVVCVLA